MKKLLTILAMASVSTLLYAQGTVYILGNEHVSTNNAISIYSGGNGAGGTASGLMAPPSSGQSYDFALLFASGASAAPALTAAGLATWQDSGITANNYLAPGFLDGTGGNTGAAANGWAIGATDWVVVVGWSANLGSTWSSVENQLTTGWLSAGYFGVSGVGEIASGGGPNPAAAVFGGTGIPNTGFALYAVPEPTTIALIGIGGIGLAMIRRRK